MTNGTQKCVMQCLLRNSCILVSVHVHQQKSPGQVQNLNLLPSVRHSISSCDKSQKRVEKTPLHRKTELNT